MKDAMRVAVKETGVQLESEFLDGVSACQSIRERRKVGTCRDSAECTMTGSRDRGSLFDFRGKRVRTR